MRTVAQHKQMLRHEQLEHAVAMSTPRTASPDRDHVQYLSNLCQQLAHKYAQLEHLRSQRATHFAQEQKPSSPHASTVRESAEAAKKTTEI